MRYKRDIPRIKMSESGTKVESCHVAVLPNDSKLDFRHLNWQKDARRHAGDP